MIRFLSWRVEDLKPLGPWCFPLLLNKQAWSFCTQFCYIYRHDLCCRLFSPILQHWTGNTFTQNPVSNVISEYKLLHNKDKPESIHDLHPDFLNDFDTYALNEMIKWWPIFSPIDNLKYSILSWYRSWFISWHGQLQALLLIFMPEINSL
jgi:hypothetical protein